MLIDRFVRVPVPVQVHSHLLCRRLGISCTADVAWGRKVLVDMQVVHTDNMMDNGDRMVDMVSGKMVDDRGDAEVEDMTDDELVGMSDVEVDGEVEDMLVQV